MRPFLFALLLVGCGASAPAPSAEPAELPTLDGLAIHPSPIDEAPREIHELLELSTAILGQSPEPPVGSSLRAAQTWLTDALGPYLEAQVERLRALEERAVSLSGTEALSASIILATAYDHVFRAIHTLPTPDALGNDERMSAAFRGTLQRASASVAQRAAAHYARCESEALPAAMQAWTARCEERGRALGSVEPPPERAAAPRTERGSIPWPSGCEAAQRVPRTPTAPEPDRTRPERVAVLLDDSVEVEDRARVLEALRAGVRSFVDAPIIPAREVLTAERLREERRVQAGGPVCGQPPPLPWILSRRNPNLVVGRVSRSCMWGADAPRSCTLHVWFSRPGTADHDGLPGALSAPMPADDTSTAAWLAAAASLGPHQPLGAIMAGSGGERGLQVRISDLMQIDPWLRPSSVILEQSDALTACLPEGAARFEASFDVSATGTPSNVAVEAGANANEAMAECVQRALEATRWPCTPAAREQQLELTLCLGRAD